MTISNTSSRRLQRALEILPGFISWNLILFPVWGAFVAPLAVAYFILAFDIFWLYKSITIAISSVVAYVRIEASQKLDWVKEIQEFPDWKKVHHVIIVVTANEPLHTLERTINSIANQTLPKEQITVVVGFESRINKKFNQDRLLALKKTARNKLGNLLFHFHTLAPGEIIGKSSNERSVAIWVKQKLIDTGRFDINYMTVTSCDADHVYHPQHFACLTFKFLDSPSRYERFWQPAIVFYNNFWKLPAMTRIANTMGSIWNSALLSRTDRLINQQNYSLSFKLLVESGYWDPDVIPEDYRIFFKAFFKTGGRVEVEPIYLPLSADAAESTSFAKTMINQYEQFKRWAWGVSDDPYIIKGFFTSHSISLSNKIIRVLKVLEDHFLWPVNWFLITIGINVVSLLNPAFSRTVIGYTLPRISSAILTVCLLFLFIILFVDSKQRPPRPSWVSRKRSFLFPLEFILMPIAGFIFSALPGLDAHTRLMLGKYLEYRVTEKV